MPCIFPSPKKSLAASSRLRCQFSSHRIATRISSWLTSNAWSIILAECCRRLDINSSAASLRRPLGLLMATNSGYTTASACLAPSRISRSCSRERVGVSGWSMRAISCGRTPSQVFMCTMASPEESTARTSGSLQYLNHTDRMQSMS
eukprot:CAMPEP_0173206644 /NCGR_PEP_ID=MMETSP1141-20130122/21467_1 /TAXON_ID=483371 /ORGANISM="non described non described, Strain CCMP2298" /LENGTH=146 /DNA_ID=CAMNT_0014132791 /DNA_START=1232 /DNA_END=1672 /DNA_ORIENTATION=-